jgi:hypothetical protein
MVTREIRNRLNARSQAETKKSSILKEGSEGFIATCLDIGYVMIVETLILAVEDSSFGTLDLVRNRTDSNLGLGKTQRCTAWNSVY